MAWPTCVAVTLHLTLSDVERATVCLAQDAGGWEVSCLADREVGGAGGMRGGEAEAGEVP